MFRASFPSEPQQLEALLAIEGISAHLFLPFCIYRLRPYAVHNTVSLQVALYNNDTDKPVLHELRLTWNNTSDTLTTPPVQDHTLTDMAACGIALAIVPLYTPQQVLAVASLNDSFDYWLGDEKQREFGLEISGTLRGRISSRAAEKRRQLQRNRYNVAGYVCVVGFEEQKVRLSFHLNTGD